MPWIWPGEATIKRFPCSTPTGHGSPTTTIPRTMPLKSPNTSTGQPPPTSADRTGPDASTPITPTNGNPTPGRCSNRPIRRWSVYSPPPITISRPRTCPTAIIKSRHSEPRRSPLPYRAGRKAHGSVFSMIPAPTGFTTPPSVGSIFMKWVTVRFGFIIPTSNGFGPKNKPLPGSTSTNFPLGDTFSPAKAFTRQKRAPGPRSRVFRWKLPQTQAMTPPVLRPDTAMKTLERYGVPRPAPRCLCLTPLPMAIRS